MSDRYTSDPHVPGDLGEPHFISDVTGFAGHVRFAVVDWRGNTVHSRRRGELDCAPPPAVQDFVDWLGGAFRPSAPASDFDRVAGQLPPYMQDLS